MTSSTGKTGRGVTFEVADSESPPNYTPIANVRSIAFTGRDAEEIDFTHLASSGGFREQRQGFKDPGSIALDLHANPTDSGHLDLLNKFLSGEEIDWRINYSGVGWNTCEYGVGFVKNPGDLNINPNDPIGGTATVRVTGGTYFANP